MLEIFYKNLPPRYTVFIAVLVSGGLLAGAHAFERLGGLDPCLLCLEQREVHWTALFVAMATFAGAWRFKSEQLMAAGLGALVIVYIFSAVLAGYHAGVEWAFWEGPQGCAAAASSTGSVSGHDILESLNGPSTLSGPPCTTAAWRMMGISMAGYNALFSAGMAGLCAVSAYAARRSGFAAQPMQGSTA